MKNKLTINQGKKFVKELAKKYFPERNQKLWTLKITEWFDEDFKMEYHSGSNGGKDYNIFLYNTEKERYYEIGETKLIIKQDLNIKKIHKKLK